MNDIHIQLGVKKVIKQLKTAQKKFQTKLKNKTWVEDARKYAEKQLQVIFVKSKHFWNRSERNWIVCKSACQWKSKRLNFTLAPRKKSLKSF